MCVVLGDIIWCVCVLPSLSVSASFGLCQVYKSGLKTEPIPPLFDLDVDASAPHGRTLDGGTIWSLGVNVPRGDSSG